MIKWCDVRGWGCARRQGGILNVTLEGAGDADAVIAVLIERFPTLNLLYGHGTRTTEWGFSYRSGSYEEEYRDAAGDVWFGRPGHYEKASFETEDEFEPLVIAKDGEVAILDPYAII
jgi:hypothetical protein